MYSPFDRGLIGWKDEKDGPMELVVVQWNDPELVFLEVNRADPRWLVYRRECEDHIVAYFTRENEAICEPGVFDYRRKR